MKEKLSEKVEEINKKVQAWLMDEGFSIKKTTLKNTLFGYDVTRQGTPNFAVIHARAIIISQKTEQKLWTMHEGMHAAFDMKFLNTSSSKKSCKEADRT